jgi:hypothetical protein
VTTVHPVCLQGVCVLPLLWLSLGDVLLCAVKARTLVGVAGKCDRL